MPVTLVTGGAGFIGSHVVDELLKAGHTVIVLDDLSGGYIEHIDQSAIFVKGSILDQILLSQLFTKYSIEYVFHFAAYAAEGLSHYARRFNYQNNLVGSVNLINESIKNKIKCFVFASSIAVYGTGKLPLKEEDLPIPEDPYGISKYAVELDLQAAKQLFDLNYIIFRPHNVYGIRQNICDRYRNVIGIFINQLIKGQPFTIFGSGMQTRAFSYIEDVAPAISNSIYKPEVWNQVFNIGADTFYTVNDLAVAVMKAMGTENSIIYLPSRKEVVDVYADHSKYYKEFNIDSSGMTSLKEGLKKMSAWAKTIDYQKPSTIDFIDLKDQLPAYWTENNK